jgi:hypothetical protein
MQITAPNVEETEVIMRPLGHKVRGEILPALTRQENSK